MSDLSPSTRALLERARRAVPSAAVKERGRERLAASLASTATLSTATAAALGKVAVAAPAVVGSFAPAVVASLLLGFGAGVATMTLGDPFSGSRESARISSPVPLRVAAPSALPRMPAPSPAPQSLPSDAMALPARLAERSSAPMSSAPSIARETELLADAQRLLGLGDARAALAVLDRYGAEFPRGALREEAFGARAVTLCALGDFVAGRRLAEGFLRSYPSSPLATRVRLACLGGEP